MSFLSTAMRRVFGEHAKLDEHGAIIENGHGALSRRPPPRAEPLATSPPPVLPAAPEAQPVPAPVVLPTPAIPPVEVVTAPEAQPVPAPVVLPTPAIPPVEVVGAASVPEATPPVPAPSTAPPAASIPQEAVNG